MERQRDLSCLAALTAPRFVRVVRAGFSELERILQKYTVCCEWDLQLLCTAVWKCASVCASVRVQNQFWALVLVQVSHFWYWFLVHEFIFAFQACNKNRLHGALGECSRDRAIAQIRTEMFYSWLSELKRSCACLRRSVETGLRC